MKKVVLSLVAVALMAFGLVSVSKGAIDVGPDPFGHIAKLAIDGGPDPFYFKNTIH